MTQPYDYDYVYIAHGSVGHSAGDGRMTCGTSAKGSSAAGFYSLLLPQLFRLLVRPFAHKEGQKRENRLDIFENRMVMLRDFAHNPIFEYLRTGHPL